MERNTETCCQIQARISAARDREHAWEIIKAAPQHLRERLISHARTVFALKRREEGKK